MTTDMTEDINMLAKDLSFGYGREVSVSCVSDHWSKSRNLPIIGAKPEGFNTEVAWYGDNFYFNYVAFRFKEAIPATFLYPISKGFGRAALSGHVQDCPISDITNFEKEYWERQAVKGFAAMIGGFNLGPTLRYLEALSKLNQKSIFNLVMDRTQHGKVDTIDGNSIDHDKLLRAVGLPFIPTTYDPIIPDPYCPEIKVDDNPAIEKLAIHWFNEKPGPCAILMTLKPGMLLPAMFPMPCDVTVDVQDTVLGDYLPIALQPGIDSEKYGERMMREIPLWAFEYKSQKSEDCKLFAERPYPVSIYYAHGLKKEARTFKLHVPNNLDAVLTILYLTRGLIPCMTERLNKGK